MTDKIRSFFQNDDAKIEKLIADNPIAVSTSAIAEFLGMDVASVRSVLDNGVVGLSWKQSCKSRKGYYIPTAQFLRWYMRIGG